MMDGAIERGKAAGAVCGGLLPGGLWHAGGNVYCRLDVVPTARGADLFVGGRLAPALWPAPAAWKR